MRIRFDVNREQKDMLTLPRNFELMHNLIALKYFYTILEYLFYANGNLQRTNALFLSMKYGSKLITRKISATYM